MNENAWSLIADPGLNDIGKKDLKRLSTITSSGMRLTNKEVKDIIKVK